MAESIIISEQVKQYFSARATLAALGMQVRHLKLFEPIMKQVKIAQKTVKFTPGEKLLDAYISILAGGHGLVEINKRLRPDPGVQAAFGRTGCAEQSVVQDTLDACTADNVEQMYQALDLIYRQHSRGYQHDYLHAWQILEVDTTGRPCGKKAAFATKGYFAHRRNRRGRHVGYVVLPAYDEIVVERVYDGKTGLSQALQPLVTAAEHTLNLDEAKRQRTILRVDSGGGSVADVNWALTHGYHFHGKDYSGLRVDHLAESVVDWFTDPREPGRQVGEVTMPTDLYCRPVRRIAVRCRKKNGKWGVGIILSSLPPDLVLSLTGQPAEALQNPQAVLLAYVYLYDQRGGGVEIEIKEDKQGLGTTHRNKKRWAAQQIVAQLEVLAHNTLVWARHWLKPYCPRLSHWGLLRLVRDVCHMNGIIRLDQAHHIFQIVLNRAEPLANELSIGFAALLAHDQVAVISGEI